MKNVVYKKMEHLMVCQTFSSSTKHSLSLYVLRGNLLSPLKCMGLGGLARNYPIHWHFYSIPVFQSNFNMQQYLLTKNCKRIFQHNAFVCGEC